VIRRRRAVLAVTRQVDEAKQWLAMLVYCRDRNIDAVTLAHDPDAAVTLVHDGFADLVVAAVVDEHRVLQYADVRVVFLREPRQSARQTMILDMLSRGGTPELVAQLLALPLREVEAVADGVQVRPSAATIGQRPTVAQARRAAPDRPGLAR
jgi:hypothetical protein